MLWKILPALRVSCTRSSQHSVTLSLRNIYPPLELIYESLLLLGTIHHRARSVHEGPCSISEWCGVELPHILTVKDVKALTADGNMGLHQALEKSVRWRMKELTDMYVTLGLDEIITLILHVRRVPGQRTNWYGNQILNEEFTHYNRL